MPDAADRRGGHRLLRAAERPDAQAARPSSPRWRRRCASSSQTKAFGGAGQRRRSFIIRAMSRPPVAFIIKKLFANALRGKIIEELEPRLAEESERRLAEIHPSRSPIPTLFWDGSACSTTSMRNGSRASSRGSWRRERCARLVQSSRKLPVQHRVHRPARQSALLYPDFVAMDERAALAHGDKRR